MSRPLPLPFTRAWLILAAGFQAMIAAIIAGSRVHAPEWRSAAAPLALSGDQAWALATVAAIGTGAWLTASIFARPSRRAANDNLMVQAVPIVLVHGDRQEERDVR